MKTKEEILKECFKDWEIVKDLMIVKELMNAMEAYHSQFAQPSDVSDEDIDNFIKAHPGNTGNVLMDISVSAGFKEGAKAHRDGKIKKGE